MASRASGYSGPESKPATLDAKVGVPLLMGGADPGGEWHLFPQEWAVLIGTQDMLLSPLTGWSWRERPSSLVDRFGAGALAWLEALLIAADRRASQLTTRDRLLDAVSSEVR